jgi:DNA-directed RNA polymerase subunit M/transcription elongation factor TFIIS
VRTAIFECQSCGAKEHREVEDTGGDPDVPETLEEKCSKCRFYARWKFYRWLR